MATWERDGIERVQRNRWWLALGATPWLAGAALVTLALATGNTAFLTPLFHLGIFGGLGLFFAYRFNRNPRYTAGRLEIDERAVSHDGQTCCLRSEIESGLLVPMGSDWLVRLKRTGLSHAVLLRVDSEAQGRDVLRALELDASQTIAKVRGLSPYFALSKGPQFALSALPAVLIGATFVGMRAGGGAVAPLAGIAFVIVMAMFSLLILRKTRISIGADGILTEWLGRKRFHGFSAIREVVPTERAMSTKRYLGIELRKHDGSTTFLPIGQARWGEEEFHATCERVREALQVYGSGAGADAARLVARGARSSREWVTALRRLGTGADADMRTAPIDVGALVRVMSDPSATPALRAGAAIALSTSDSAREEHRVRIQAAAGAAAAPKLRIALQKAAEPTTTEEELAELLAELEAEERPRGVKA